MPEVLRNPYDPTTSTSSEGVVELSLLLPAAQASELEAAAFQRGMTTGEMVRHLVRDFLNAQKAGTAGISRLFRNHVGPNNGH